MITHAKLSASGSHRWMHCPGSVIAEEAFPDTSSEYAEEGTSAHELAEKCLRMGNDAVDYHGQEFNGFTVDLEMAEAVQMYLDTVRSLKGKLYVEQRVDYSPWVPEGFGTSDAVVVSGKTAIVLDLKYGKGVPVHAENNSQAMLYALGVMNEMNFLYEFDEYHLFIVQPRLNHISDVVVSMPELMDFAKKAVAAAKATLEPEAKRIPSESACRFCKAKATCRTLAEHNLDIAIEGFEAIEPDMQTKDITIQDIATLLPQLDLIQNWIKGVQDHALNMLEEGEEIPGYKLVEGRSVRKWVDDEQAEKTLRRKLKVSELFTKKLISPTQAEKILGKGNPILTDIVVKPPGKPSIAKESDKRPAIDLASLAGQDFDEVA